MRDNHAPWRGQLPVGVIGVAGAALLLWRLALTTGLSGDVYWQWTAGQWMLAHHRLMTTDVFSYSVRGRPWLTEEWGYEVLLAGLVSAVGPVGFWILSAGVGTLTVATVAARTARAAGWSWAGLLTLFLAMGLVLFQRDRPQELSYWFFALLLCLIAWVREDGRRFWWVGLLLLIWANIHGSFLLAMAVLGWEALLTLAAGRRWGRLTVTGFSSFASGALTAVVGIGATLVNPHGFQLWSYAYHVASNPSIANVIQEWQPPDFHQPVLLMLVAVPVMLTVIGSATTERPIPLGALGLAGALLLATLDSVRFMPYFLIAWCVLMADFQPWRLRAGRPNRLVWPAMMVLAVILLSGRSYPPGTPASDQPVSAVQFLSGRPGRIFATYRWGDYLIYAHVPVFIDGRTDLYTGTGVLATYLAVSNLTVDPDTIFRDYRVRYVLWTPGTALATFLQHDPRWQEIYATPAAVIFEHRGRWPQAASFHG
jgi:hypothetical protein